MKRNIFKYLFLLSVFSIYGCDSTGPLSLGPCTKHTYTTTVITEATHLIDGLLEHTCSTCGHKDYETVPRNTDHSFKYTVLSETQHRRTCVCGIDEITTHEMMDKGNVHAIHYDYMCNHFACVCGFEIFKHEVEVIDDSHHYDTFSYNNEHNHKASCSREGCSSFIYEEHDCKIKTVDLENNVKVTCSKCNYERDEEKNEEEVNTKVY